MIWTPKSRIEKKDYSTFFSVKNKYTKIYYLKTIKYALNKI